MREDELNTIFFNTNHMPEFLTPLPEALKGISQRCLESQLSISQKVADNLARWMPALGNGVKCVTNDQIWQIVKLVSDEEELAIYEKFSEQMSMREILETARNIYALAIRDCLHCSTNECSFRDDKPEE